MKNMKKILSLLLCVMLVAALFAGCANKAADNGPVTIKEGATYGKGAKEFTFVVTDLEGKSVTCTVKTDKDMVGEALMDNGLVEGDQSEWGLYVTTVNGITCSWDTDKTYWAFYIDGEYAMTGVDATEVNPGSTYTFAVEKGE